VELEIEELKASNSLNASNLNLSLEKAKTSKFLLIGTLALLLLASVLFYSLTRSHRLKKQLAEDQLKTTRKIQEERFKLAETEKEVTIKQEIAAELHDNILSSLSGIRLSAEQLLISAAIKDEKSNTILTNLEKNIKSSASRYRSSVRCLYRSRARSIKRYFSDKYYSNSEGIVK